MEHDILKSYIKELNRSSHKAFNAIYDMYVDKIYSFALAHSKSREIAGDIVQDTFLRLWSMRESLSVDGSLQSLLFTIANHRLIDAFRKQINQAEMELYISYKEAVRQREGNQADSELLYDDFVKILKLCKKLLTDRELEVYELSREKGKTIDEISEELNLAEQTVKNQLTTALKKIKEGLLKTKMFYFFL
ncbi:MAG: RNA polymerase sigma factor [Paludibacteraceae bacterium]